MNEQIACFHAQANGDSLARELLGLTLESGDAARKIAESVLDALDEYPSYGDKRRFLYGLFLLLLDAG